MSERKWTDAQLSAITSKEKNMILSAAAGSGKTATLTERIIRLLKDPESGADLSRMLIVTFTVAAAGELKTRISDALSEAIAKDPKSPHLTRQLASLEGARISTIDSFFKSELRPYFSALGLPPDFGILDVAEAEVLKKEAMEETVSSFFDSGEDSVGVIELFDCLSTARSEKDLTESLLKTVVDLGAYDIDSDKLRLMADELEGSSDDFFATRYSDSLKDLLTRTGHHYRTRFSILSSSLSDDPNTEKYVEEAQRLAELSKSLSTLEGGTFNEAYRCFSDIEFPRLSPIKRGESSEAYEIFKNVRSSFKDEVYSLKNDFFTNICSYPEAMKKTAAHIRALSTVYDRFLSLYGEKKRERGGCDFEDLSRFARRIFVNEDGTPTKAAIETGEKFDYIFIDEYQDTNAIQDSVFAAVSGKAGRFMVGDIKQSIYGFRGSCPELFRSLRDRYSEGYGGSAVFMSENFRSDTCVIDLSNIVSQYIFQTGATPFDKCDKLVASKSGADTGNTCEIIMVERENELGQPDDSLPTEEECVANRISELLSAGQLSDGSPVRPKDIAILLRSGTHADDYVRALANLGIPANNRANEDFFDHGEVLLMLCLLNTADNPLRDIYLAGAMKSPLFGFTLSDLVNIRKTTSVPLWYSLCDYCERGEDSNLRKKCISFRQTVDRWRQMASELYCDEMLRLIVSDTSLRSYGGDDERKNKDIIRSLKALSDSAAQVAKRGGTIHDLIGYLNSVIEKKEKAVSLADPDSVTILTIHRSKGLEYPICFLAECSKQFNMRDTTEKLLIERSGLVGMKLYDKSSVVRCDNPIRRAVALTIEKNSIDEEARVLYVALTRARERLIVSCKVKSFEKKMESNAELTFFSTDSHEVMSFNTYGDWILTALARFGYGTCYTYKKGTDIKGMPLCTWNSTFENGEELSAFFKKALDFSYDKEYLWNIPAKLSVSVLKPDILGSEDEREYFDAPVSIKMAKEAPLPAFLSGKSKDDAAARGTATHIFMQFTSFEELHKRGEEAEMARLVEKRFISQENADLVRIDEIALFKKSDLFKELLCAKEIMRERRFNTLLPAEDFTTDEALREKLHRDGTVITVQGVVDCIYTDSEGKTHLVDYKTDRLTKAELENKALAYKKLRDRHTRQLLIYKKVCEQMLGRPLDSVSIYSLQLGESVEIEN